MRISIVGIFALLIACAIAHRPVIDEAEARFMYEQFKRTYDRVTSNEDDDMRFAVFRNNLNRIQQLQENEQGTAQYGVTKFADMTAQEFAAIYTNARFDKIERQSREPLPMEFSIPQSSFDWRTKGAVGPVLNQGSCGSCWAFSVIGNIEGQWFRKTRSLLSLSQQQLVDCDKFDKGCHGGYPPETYGEIRKMGGLMKNQDYGYTGRDGSCRMRANKFVAYINSSIVLPSDEQYQATYLTGHGPLSSALNADYLQFYQSGVMHPSRWNCSPRGLNHAVLTVGYGVDAGTPYWIVKNSWGSDFGEGGYFRIYRGDGTCGIDQVVSSSIIY